MRVHPSVDCQPGLREGVALRAYPSQVSFHRRHQRPIHGFLAGTWCCGRGQAIRLRFERSAYVRSLGLGFTVSVWLYRVLVLYLSRARSLSLSLSFLSLFLHAARGPAAPAASPRGSRRTQSLGARLRGPNLLAPHGGFPVLPGLAAICSQFPCPAFEFSLATVIRTPAFTMPNWRQYVDQLKASATLDAAALVHVFPN